MITATHVFGAPGEYTITLAVEDDELDTGIGAAGITIVDLGDAAQLVIDDLIDIAADPTVDPDAVKEINKAIAELDKALGKFGEVKLREAANKEARAIDKLIKAEEKDPTLDLTREMAFLAHANKSSAVVAINFAESIDADPKKIQDALNRLAEGDGLMAAADYRNAAIEYRDAAGKVEKFLERPPARVYEEGENMITAALEELTVLAIDPSVNDKAQGKIADAIDDLNKALDAIADDDAKHGIDQTDKALQKLENAEDKDAGIDLDDIKDSLAGAARSLAVDAIDFAENNPSADPIKIEDARDRVTEGDALRDANDYRGATKKYQDAVKKIDKLI